MPKTTFHDLPADKRARIADVAVEHFSGRGYRGTTISAIVADSGIAKGSFYQYFESKLDLFRWLVFDVIARRKMDYLAAVDHSESDDFWTLLGRLMLGGIRFGLENPTGAPTSGV